VVADVEGAASGCAERRGAKCELLNEVGMYSVCIFLGNRLLYMNLYSLRYRNR